MDHIFRVGVSGEIPGMEDLIEYGRRPGGVYVPRFRNLKGDEGSASGAAMAIRARPFVTPPSRSASGRR